MPKPKVEGVPAYVRDHPAELRHFVVSKSEDEIIDLVLTGQLAMEAIPDDHLRSVASQAYQKQQRTAMQRLVWKQADQLEREMGDDLEGDNEEA